MNLTDTVEEPAWHNSLVTACVFVVGVCGLLWNGLAIVVVKRNPILNNSFGLLCVSHSIANLGVLFVFIVWVGPTTAWQQEELAESYLGRHLGQLNIFFWDVCVYSHLAISINRIISISVPHKAKQLLSIRNTLIALGIVWSLGFCHIIPYFWHSECYISYSPSGWTWNFAETECGAIISTYFDYYTGVLVFILICCMDMITLFQLHKINRAAVNGQPGVLQRSRKKVETRFFMQTCVQGSIFFYELFNFYYVSSQSTDPLFVYFTSTFAWQICHALDGLVVLLFHWRGAFCRGSGRGIITVSQPSGAHQTHVQPHTSHAHQKGTHPTDIK